MDDDRWQVLSGWLSGWLEADPQVRLRLRDELSVSHPELVRDADRMISSADSLTGFLETPALVLAARELAVDAPVLPAGSTIGPYRVVQLLARGGMGDVYRATDSRLGRDVALKVLSPGRTGDPRRVERFLMEARVTASLDHRNIVRVYDVGRVDDQAYLVTELLDGETLRARIVHGPIAPEEVRNIALGVARGLAAAHAAGLVHRDLKPENIFLTRNGETKLLDFGIAKLTQDENVPDGASTLTGVVLGTAGYLAPEQVRGEGVDARADLFAFGAVLFEMVTGSRAFVREQIVDTLHAILHDPPALELEHRPGVPMSLSTIVGRLLQKAPGARFQSAAELIGALERADVGRTRSWPERQVARIRAGLRRPIWQAVAAAMVVALVWAGVVLWKSWSLPAINSIAVSAFDCTAVPDIEYICDGMTEGLVDRLSHVRSPIVVKAPRKTAETLRLGAVVTGVVSRRGPQTVISASLIHLATGTQLWGPQPFEPPDVDIMSVQDSVALSIAEALRLRLSQQEKAQLRGSGTNNPEAYRLYWKGRRLLRSDRPDDDLEARDLFIKSTEIDPNYLNAHLAIVSTFIRSLEYAPPRQAMADAEAALAKAADIDPNNVSVRVSKAHLRLMEQYDWAATEREYLGVMNEPSLLRTTAYHAIAIFFAAIRKPDDSVELVQRALDVDPSNLESQVMRGNYLLQAQRYEEAKRVYDQIKDGAPNDPRPWFGLAEVHKRRNDFPKAAEARRKAHEVDGDDRSAQEFTGATTETKYAEAERKLARAELHRLEELRSLGYIPAFAFARLHAQIGNRKLALDYLERALKEGGHPGLMMLRVDPAWASVRVEPRFQEVVHRFGLR